MKRGEVVIVRVSNVRVSTVAEQLVHLPGHRAREAMITIKHILRQAHAGERFHMSRQRWVVKQQKVAWGREGERRYRRLTLLGVL